MNFSLIVRYSEKTAFEEKFAFLVVIFLFACGSLTSVFIFASIPNNF